MVLEIEKPGEKTVRLITDDRNRTEQPRKGKANTLSGIVQS